MPGKDWEWLHQLQFGLIIFPRDGRAIPPMISNGDLDGDLYFVCWDELVVEGAQDPTNEEEEKESDPFESSDDLMEVSFKTEYNGKMMNAIVDRKLGTDNYLVRIGHAQEDFSRKEILQDKTVVEKAIDHTGTGKKIEVQIRWIDGSCTWEKLHGFHGLRYECPEIMAEYAAKSKLLEEPGWEWSKGFLRDEENETVLDHRKNSRGLIQIKVQWDKSDVEWKDLSWFQINEDEKEEEPPAALITYVQEKKLIGADWKWVNSHINKAKEKWLQYTQDILADSNRLTCIASLTKKLYSAHTNAKKLQDKVAYGRAYKESNDIRKHGGRVHLPFRLWTKASIPK